ncbi:MAG: class I SAM-dependent rRNA methyltransferase [Anaerolineaceae bacterium]|nr:class I SAM-dependent rRNA methyltransferase [Anaerolineaceae bacterium]
MADKFFGFKQIQLQKDLIKNIKRGHCWVYANALRNIPTAKSGSAAVLLDNRGGKPIAVGFLDPQHPIPFRICSTQIVDITRENWLLSRLNEAFAIRQQSMPPATTAYRLINGEGDRLPGMICDIYNEYAVIQFDSAGCRAFYAQETIINWLQTTFSLKSIIDRSRFHNKPLTLFGTVPNEPVTFNEYGHLFTADLQQGQKTGFFLDQRENRRQIELIANGKQVVNIFGYTGGFSVYAGKGGASEVTTVDIAKPAVETANTHWQMNGLSEGCHLAVASDAYQFMDEAIQTQRNWDIVILDPPSFAHSEASVPKAMAAYQTLIEKGARITRKNGYLALSSCSSHITQEMFIQCCEEGVSKARRKAVVLKINSQSSDHPAPLAMSELRYLKFVLLKIVND